MHGPDRTRRRSAPRRPPSRGAWAILLLAGGLAVDGVAAPPAGRIHGLYRLHGEARLDAGPLLSREVEIRADAVLRPGEGRRSLRVRLASEGEACELAARLDQEGAIAFEPGQRCAVTLREPGARGRVEARLSGGSGRVGDARLALELSWTLSGTVSLRTAERAEVLGKGIDLPSTWTPEIPVRGEAQTRAEGGRDDSKAAERVLSNP